ncbi:MAG TPA: SAM-dependent methyltransferase [Phenylobacterium sp.]|jgi:NADH dehydrogenase [ubiquinone] 1 alpha subcomplex assembly factor 7|uniref:class I SAM-dependent methyltransferase n=1 Tax=Phenylobacterium sp. TaxID=1871053 RepID=UPI002BC36030|nr:SAM-dependent methyltransferase [Phenylobacterium sp.]HXA39109.1 SAM-dependent methyltransferase [Phenylobacterium sp.]
MPLRDRLTAQIAAGGPITVAQYMGACLHDPDFGYYATRPALGEAGDFITAPMVSQMFGELIGVWAAAAWELMGRPDAVRLVEMGPGDGTLMGDILKTIRHAPGLLEAADVWLVETSAPLRALQADRLGGRVQWARSLAEVPAEAPLMLIANELLDCLPARQFVRTAIGWAEQVVGLDAEGELAFGLAPTPVAGLLPDAAPGQVFEQSAAQAALGAELGARIAADGGAALLIDYGRAEPGFGDTLQALRRHEKVDPLADPGAADLTVHADFPAVMAAARGQGAEAAILTQGEFLARMGIGQRAEALVRAAPGRSGAIGRQLTRLIAGDEMGELFKACAIHAPGWTPPAFEEAE